MSVTAYKNPSDNGDIGAEFSNPSNAYTSNNVDATADTTGGEYVQHDYTGFGFTTSDVPAGSVLDGFEVSVEGGTGLSLDEQVVDIAMVKVGSGVGFLANTQSFTRVADATKVIGSSTDKAGTTWLDTDVIAATFGVIVRVYNNGTLTDQFQLDHVKLRIYYHAPPAQTGRVTAAQADITYSRMTGRVVAAQADVSYSPTTGRVSAIQGDIVYNPKTGRITGIQGDLTYDRMGGRITAMQGDIVYTVPTGRITAVDATPVYGEMWYMMGPVYCTMFGQYKNEWTDAGFARIEEGIYASSLGDDPANDEQDYYRFLMPALPADAIPKGIIVTVAGSCSHVGSVMTLEAQLLKYVGTTPTPVGTPILNTCDFTDDRGLVYGGQELMWDASLTRADVSNPHFGVYFRTRRVSGTDGFRVDWVRMEVAYVLPSQLDGVSVVKVESSGGEVRSIVIPGKVRSVN